MQKRGLVRISLPSSSNLSSFFSKISSICEDTCPSNKFRWSMDAQAIERQPPKFGSIWYWGWWGGGLKYAPPHATWNLPRKYPSPGRHHPPKRPYLFPGGWNPTGFWNHPGLQEAWEYVPACLSVYLSTLSYLTLSYHILPDHTLSYLILPYLAYLVLSYPIHLSYLSLSQVQSHAVLPLLCWCFQPEHQKMLVKWDHFPSF